MSNIKIRKFYIKDIKHQLGASPIWPINSRYKLGDYGYYSKRTGHFSVRGNLFEDLGVPEDGVKVSPVDSEALLYKVFNSHNTSRNDFKTNVNVSPQTGELELGFSGERSYFFHLFGAKVAHIKLNDEVKNKLIEAKNSGKWRYRYRIVEVVYDCPDVRFVFSLSETASVNLKGNVALGQSVTKGTIDYIMESSSNMDGSFWIGNAPSTPFVHFSSFKRRELKFHDQKVLIGDDWNLESDNTGSFDDDEDLESHIDSIF